MTYVRPSGWWTPCHGDVTQLVNSRCCVFVLLTLAAIHVVIVSVYIPDPMPCFCPAYMTEDQCRHMKTTCRTSAVATYRIDDVGIDTKTTAPVSSYYHNVNLILILQAFLFYTPSLIWKEIARKVGVLPEDLAISAVEARHTTNRTDKESAVWEVTRHIQLFCTRQLRRRHMSYAFWWLHGSKLVFWKLMSKIIYGANVIGQFFLLDAFLGMPFHDYGWQMLGRLPSSYTLGALLQSMLGLDEDDLKQIRTGHLPANLSEKLDNRTLSALSTQFQDITGNDVIEFHTEFLCDSTIRQMGNSYTHTIQCILPINPVNEIVFRCVWFLLFTTAIITLTSLIFDIFKFFTFDCRRMSIRERLQNWGILKKHDPRAVTVEAEITAFERFYLQRDGLLLIEYIKDAAGDVMADDVLAYLWTTYKENSEDLIRITSPISWTEEVDDQLVEVIHNHQPVMRTEGASLEMGDHGAWGSGDQQLPPYEHLPTKDTHDE